MTFTFMAVLLFGTYWLGYAIGRLTTINDERGSQQ